jgi:hypothetical protein
MPSIADFLAPHGKHARVTSHSPLVVKHDIGEFDGISYTAHYAYDAGYCLDAPAHVYAQELLGNHAHATGYKGPVFITKKEGECDASDIARMIQHVHDTHKRYGEPSKCVVC